MHSSNLLSCFIAIALIIMSQIPASAHKLKKTPGVSRYVRIPLLYMTDRAYVNKTFLNQRKIEEGSIYDVYSGTLECTIENSQYKTLTPAQEKLGWHYADKLLKNPISEMQLSESGKKCVYAQLGEKLIETANKVGTNEFFVNVHGFNNPFSGSAKSAAKLAYAAERPVLLYSWPSAGRIIFYDVDGTNNEWSQEHFNRLMEELVCVKRKSNLTFSLVAHSMGNRLAVRSASILKGKNLFEQVFLVDPDLDAETFVHYVARYSVGGREEKVIMAKTDNSTVSSEASNVPENSHGKLRILFSHHDNALPIVQLLFSGGYTRLGQGADTMLASVFDPNTLPNIMQGAAELFQPTSDKEDATDVSADKEDDSQYFKLARAFEWIDYTLLDHGILGHTVPCELIASLWATGQPGKGLKLVTTENGSINRFTRFASRVFRQTKHVGDVGRCEKVVYDKNVQGKLVMTPEAAETLTKASAASNNQ
jgi:pimeloyl-ACP methyl ester carboxylesterase